MFLKTPNYLNTCPTRSPGPCSASLLPEPQGLLNVNSYSSLGFNLLRKWKVKVKSLSLTLCDPMDCSLPGSSVHGIFQARILKWFAFSFPRRSSQSRDWTQVSCIVARCYSISLEEDGKCFCCSVVGNALGKCQFVVDIRNIKIIILSQ